MESPRQPDDGGREASASATEDVEVTEQNPPVQNTIPPVTRPDPPTPKEEAQTQPPLQSNPDVVYINTADTGWPAMAHNVREVDEQKVKGHKEDIDTILVFVSAHRLYSCVVTSDNSSLG